LRFNTSLSEPCNPVERPPPTNVHGWHFDRMALMDALPRSFLRGYQRTFSQEHVAAPAVVHLVGGKPEPRDDLRDGGKATRKAGLQRARSCGHAHA
jgi:hypothetical protein